MTTSLFGDTNAVASRCNDGLFFFDIYLSPEYPNVPPMVYYNSGGLSAGRSCFYYEGLQRAFLKCLWTSNSETYMRGAPIGHAFDCGKPEEEAERGSSTGFKILLVDAFSDKGIDTSDFLDQVHDNLPIS
ncbi:(E3-independent) E2 ubiquitin-conjugating enzyme [Salvia divinorum]|uniref:(E3-independent) E2 ubiquitin-conjugating enzyme n=1 Tax=Salvia divinorum TaxID=28513 RepID=A0ABD1III9_SALDI